MSLPTTNDQRRTLRNLVFYFLRLGAIGFGGPIALAGAMQHDLVEERGWITREEYLRGLALAQLARAVLRYATKKGIVDFVDGVTAAATGAIAGAAFVLGRRALVDVTTIAICAAIFVVITVTKKVPEPLLIVAAAGAGLVLR